MKMVPLSMLVALGLSSIFIEEASASEWGCEVLLCAASSAPSWQSIATCRPPMEKLIRAMKRPGFSWPTCPEGGAGKPGYEKYSDCPAGWAPVQGGDDSDRSGRAELSRCYRTVDECGQPGNRRSPTSDVSEQTTRIYSDNHLCRYTEFIARPSRDKPYYFDIRDNASKTMTRYFFDLHR